MSEPVQRYFSQEDFITASTAYMSEYFGPIPKDEPARTSWYEHYGMLINFGGYMWACNHWRPPSPFSADGDKA